ncbi:hypothetical protein [Burkholderia stagnalis]|uniref:non-homologous end-joining DNA ligase LigD n=1 Tax=Burkholderia stagnalis TaxID=1503054 RepID=UPI002ED90109
MRRTWRTWPASGHLCSPATSRIETGRFAEAARRAVPAVAGRGRRSAARHLRDRPVALVCASKASPANCSSRKNAEKLAIPGIASLGKWYAGQPVMMINSLQALLGAAQMGAVEFHIWNATRKNLDCPDWLILDQDPDPASSWKRMVETMQLTLVVPDRLTAVSGPSRDAHGIDRVEIHRQIDHELMWLRVMPENGPGKTWTISEIRRDPVTLHCLDPRVGACSTL